jgi:hypothetical protein
VAGCVAVGMFWFKFWVVVLSVRAYRKDSWFLFYPTITINFLWDFETCGMSVLLMMCYHENIEYDVVQTSYLNHVCTALCDVLCCQSIWWEFDSSHLVLHALLLVT